MKKKNKICVIIPCYKVSNEILGVLNKINFNTVDKVIIIDDYCPDKSGVVAKKIQNKKIVVITHNENKGVGGATITGFKIALKLNYDIIIKIDGDGQHQPSDLKKFINFLSKDKYNFCKGTRYKRNSEKNKIPYLRFLGNNVLTLLTNINCRNNNITDCVNGFIGVKATLLKKINLNLVSKGFFFEEDLLFHLSLTRNLKIKEISIKTLYFGKSNLKPILTILPFILKHCKNFLARIYHDINLK